MMGETRAFFREILHSESSALQFIDADFTMLNASLRVHRPQLRCSWSIE